MRTITTMRSLTLSLSTAALGLAACQGVPDSLENVGEARLAAGAMNPNTILILDTAGDGAVYEAQMVMNAGYIPEVVDAIGWQSKAPGEFATYKALVIGDLNCSGTNPSQLAVATATNTIWTPEVTGNVIVVGTDPESHTANGANLFASEAIGFAAAGTGTGAYVSLGCYYFNAAPGTTVPVLSGFGTFTVEGDTTGHFDAHQVATAPSMVLVSDASLSNWSPTSSRELFNSFPASFAAHVIVEDVAPGAPSFPDGSLGIPYVVSRGATVSLCGNNQMDPGEQCDDGNYVSGDGCTEDCFLNAIACGDWDVDQGEQCDDGNTTGGDGCSATCQWEVTPSIGACCVSGGGCVEALSPTACVAMTGVYTADTLTCADVSSECFNFLGACCMPNGGCADALTAATCLNKGGSYLGDMVSCADEGWQCLPLPPQTGACCVGNTCTEMTEQACNLEMGVFSGVGSICDETTCPGCTTSEPIGACCVEGQCLMLSAEACFTNGGLYAGDGSLCTSGVCDCGGPTGCCEEITAGCSMTAGETTRSGSIFATVLAALSATFFARRRR